MIAAVILSIWLLFGAGGILTCRNNQKINWCMLAFLITSPFMAFLKLVI